MLFCHNKTLRSLVPDSINVHQTMLVNRSAAYHLNYGLVYMSFCNIVCYVKPACGSNYLFLNMVFEYSKINFNCPGISSDCSEEVTILWVHWLLFVIPLLVTLCKISYVLKKTWRWRLSRIINWRRISRLCHWWRRPSTMDSLFRWTGFHVLLLSHNPIRYLST